MTGSKGETDMQTDYYANAANIEYTRVLPRPVLSITSFSFLFERVRICNRNLRNSLGCFAASIGCLKTIPFTFAVLDWCISIHNCVIFRRLLSIMELTLSILTKVYLGLK